MQMLLLPREEAEELPNGLKGHNLSEAMTQAGAAPTTALLPLLQGFVIQKEEIRQGRSIPHKFNGKRHSRREAPSHPGL